MWRSPLFQYSRAAARWGEGVDPAELEIAPCCPAVGIALEHVDLGGEHVQPDRLLLAVEPRLPIAVFDLQTILGLPLLPLANCLLPAIPRTAGILGDFEQRLLQVELERMTSSLACPMLAERERLTTGRS